MAHFASGFLALCLLVMITMFPTWGAIFMVLQINLMAVTIALVLLHFYLDGLFWAFKQPEVRRAIAPYLVGYGARPASARPAGSVADIEPAH